MITKYINRKNAIIITVIIVIISYYFTIVSIKESKDNETKTEIKR